MTSPRPHIPPTGPGATGSSAASSFALAARALSVDTVTAEAVRALREAQIEPLLLKGPGVASWLYPEGGRGYADTDLLVAPHDHGRAMTVVEAGGFNDVHTGFSRWERPSYATTLVRECATARQAIDLHWTLPRVTASPEVVWAVMSYAPDELFVGGVGVVVPNLACRTFHVSLHAAQHGDQRDRALEDMRRALRVLTLEQWRGAATIAAQLDAEALFVAGLRISPDGATVAAQLGLDLRLPTRIALTAPKRRTRAADLPLRLDAPRLADRMAQAGRLVVPSVALMRSHKRLARRGRAGLLLAYVLRAGDLMLHVPEALIAWRRATSKE